MRRVACIAGCSLRNQRPVCTRRIEREEGPLAGKPRLILHVDLEAHHSAALKMPALVDRAFAAAPLSLQGQSPSCQAMFPFQESSVGLGIDEDIVEHRVVLPSPQPSGNSSCRCLKSEKSTRDNSWVATYLRLLCRPAPPPMRPTQLLAECDEAETNAIAAASRHTAAEMTRALGNKCDLRMTEERSARARKLP